MIQGDFTFVLGNANRLGGNPVNEKATMKVQDWVINTNLLE